MITHPLSLNNKIILSGFNESQILKSPGLCKPNRGCAPIRDYNPYGYGNYSLFLLNEKIEAILNSPINQAVLYNSSFKSFLKEGALNNPLNLSQVRNFSSNPCLLSLKGSSLGFKGAYAGFKSYDEEFHVGVFDPNDLSSCVEGVRSFIDILESDKIYSVLAIINYVEDGRLLSKTVSRESLKMHKSSDAGVIAKIIIDDLENAIFKYAIPENFDLYFRYRVWLDELSYKDKWIGIQRGVNEALSDKLLKVDGNDFFAIDRRLNSLNLGSFKLPGLNYGKKVFNSNIIENLNLDFMKDYNLPIIEICEPLLKEDRFYDDVQNVEYHVININKTTFFVQCFYLNEIGGKTKGTSWFDISLIENPDNISLDNDVKLIWFKRYFKDFTISYDLNGKEISRESRFNVNFLKQTEQENEYKNNFLTYDFETYKDENNNSIVYCAATFDGENFKTYYLSDYPSSDDLILAMLNGLLVKKYHNHIVYAHNGSNFDTYPIIDVVLRYSDKFNISMIDKDMGSFVSVKVSTKLIKGSNISISFYDSNLLISGSLDSILKDFKCETLKGSYPYDFINKYNLNYIGVKPDYKYFNTDLNNYNLIENNNWNLKEETIKYIRSDVIGLYQALSKYSKEIHERFFINITNHKTFSSLSWDIFLSNFFDPAKYKVPILKGRIDKDIRKAYYGGITEVYKPVLVEGKKLDKNSHYAEAMLNSMPTGTPKFSNDKILDNYFGYVFCKIEAPDEKTLKNPVLGINLPNKGTIYPRGVWHGWYFSERVKEVRDKYSYKVEVLCGYKFEKSDGLFKNFIDYFYDLKLKATIEKNGVQRNLAKNNLVSIFGKAGQNKIEYKVKVLKSEEFSNFDKERDVMYSYKFGDKILVRYGEYLHPKILKALSIKPRYTIDSSEDYSYSYSSSVAIAAAVTAFGQMSMIPFLNDPNNECTAIATDCVHLQNNIDCSLINEKLGAFKLEANIDIGLYPTTNTYYINGTDASGKSLEVCKSRGLGKDLKKKPILNKDDYVSLIMGLPVTKTKIRFHKDLKKGSIKITEDKITLSGKLNNRIKLFSVNGIWYDTKPLTVGLDLNNKNYIIDENPLENINKYPLIKYAGAEDSGNNIIKNTCSEISENNKKFDKENKLRRLKELENEFDKIEHYLDKIAFSKEKYERSSKIYEEIKELRAECGIKFQEKPGTEWSSQMFDLENPDFEDSNFEYPDDN